MVILIALRVNSQQREHRDDINMKNEIVNYLNSKEPDFNSGFRLLCKFSKNESLISWIGRKHDDSRLLYELEKLSKFDNLTESPLAEIHEMKYGLALDKEEPADESESGNLNFRTVDDRKIRRSDLPENLQKVYDEIAENYKFRRVLHEKMKLAKADADRANFRSQIIEMQNKIAEGWKEIDTWNAENLKKKLEDDFKESSCRSYISKALKAKKISQKTIDGVKERLKALKEHDCIISDDTIAKLKEKGLV